MTLGGRGWSLAAGGPVLKSGLYAVDVAVGARSVTVVLAPSRVEVLAASRGTSPCTGPRESRRRTCRTVSGSDAVNRRFAQTSSGTCREPRRRVTVYAGGVGARHRRGAWNPISSSRRLKAGRVRQPGIRTWRSRSGFAISPGTDVDRCAGSRRTGQGPSVRARGAGRRSCGRRCPGHGSSYGTSTSPAYPTSGPAAGTRTSIGAWRAPRRSPATTTPILLRGSPRAWPGDGRVPGSRSSSPASMAT